MPTRRQERVAKRIVQETVEALRNLKHVKLGFITVTRCDVSPDLRHAKIFLSVFGDEEEQARTLQLIHNNATKIRHMIARPLGIKMTPQLQFEFDESVANADRMSRLIHDARLTDANPNPLTPEEEAERLAALRAEKKPRRSEDARDEDPFETARREVENELLGEEDDVDEFDDPDWKPINLDDLPDDDDDEGESEEDGKNS